MQLKKASNPMKLHQPQQPTNRLNCSRGTPPPQVSVANSITLVALWKAGSLHVILGYMSEVTRILKAVENGDLAASDQLLPLVYEELRKLASIKLVNEKPGQTLQATALVHEAYLRLLGAEARESWDSKGHFFAAAAEAMRRILVEKARQKKTQKRGGDRQRQELRDVASLEEEPPEELLFLD